MDTKLTCLHSHKVNWSDNVALSASNMQRAQLYLAFTIYSQTASSERAQRWDEISSRMKSSWLNLNQSKKPLPVSKGKHIEVCSHSAVSFG